MSRSNGFWSHKAALLTLLFFIFGSAAAGFCPCSHAAEQPAAALKAAQGHDCCPKSESQKDAKDCSADDCLHHRTVTVDAKADFVVPSAFSYSFETAPAVSETPLFLEGLRAFSYQTDAGRGAHSEPLYVLFRSLLI